MALRPHLSSLTGLFTSSSDDPALKGWAIIFRPYRDYEQLVAEQYSMAPTTLDRLIRSEARLDSLAPKHGLLAS